MGKKENEPKEFLDSTVPGPEPTEQICEEEIIFKAVASLRNRAKKLSPGGRERLFAMVRSYIG